LIGYSIVIDLVYVQYAMIDEVLKRFT
jgi:hypothetical protein